MPYRGGALTPEAGQRFLDDFRDEAHELVPGVHVGVDYVVVKHARASTVIPIGPVTAHADSRTLVVTKSGERGTRDRGAWRPLLDLLRAQALERDARHGVREHPGLVPAEADGRAVDVADG